MTEVFARLRGARRAGFAVAAAMAAALGLAASAQAEFGPVPGSFTADAFNRAGGLETQAGAHPYAATTSFDLNRRPGQGFVDEYVRNIDVTLPAGFVGDPTAVPKCSKADFNGMVANVATCPVASQVGITAVRSFLIPLYNGEHTNNAPVYNVEPARGVAAEFGFVVGTVPVRMTAKIINNGEYRLQINLKDISQGIPTTGATFTLWGDPADPSHDAERGYLFQNFSCADANAFTPGSCPGQSITGVGQRLPFLTNPVSCRGPQTTDWQADSWEDSGDDKQTSYTTSVGVDGCDRVTFDPSFDTAVDTSKPDSPTGLSVELSFPQNNDPDGLATGQLRKATVTLPAGMTVSPSSADGLGACSDQDLGLGNTEAARCPDSAKIGTLTATSPLLDEQLTGAIYLRTQASSDPESGEMFRLALVLGNEDRGVVIKLPGSIVASSDLPGIIKTTFDNNPQSPVSNISLRFKSGPRAPLATPAACGPQTVDAQLESWSGQSVNRQTRFMIDCGGRSPFAPSFEAGTVNPAAGASSALGVRVGRPDGQPFLDGLSLNLPTGLTAKLAGVPVCGDAQAGAGTCPEGARVGTATIGAGPGSNPYSIQGGVYLTGPYKDAPIGLAVAVRVIAGPFDLGTVVVRQKVYVDPIDAHVTVVSDPLPTIVKGVPVRLQRLEVSVDKPGFMINPTSCETKAVTGTATAVGGQTAAITNRFQATDCAGLDLKPKLALSLSGKGQTTDGKHPAVIADVMQKPGQANLKKVRVALPSSVALDPDNATGLCEFVDGSKVVPTCPKESIVGTATATTPILAQPLSGPVYFVKNIRIDKKSGRQIKTLPKLVIPLLGENGLRLTLTGTSDVDDDRLVTTFDNIPDAPVSSFKLNIIGGKRGILVVSGDRADICKSTQVADQQVDGQNGKAADGDVFIQTPSCPLKVLSQKVGKSSVAVKVGGLGAGKVTVTGKGIKKTTKTITKSTVATITAKRTKGTPGKVTVAFDPAGPAKARKTSR